MKQEGFLTCNIQQMQNRLYEFLNTNSRISKWNLYFHEEFRDDLFRFGMLIGEAGQFVFFHIDKGYIIGRSTRGMITSYVVLSENFSDAEIFYSTDIENFNIRDLTVPLNQSFRYWITSCRSIIMHASAVIYKGKVILFTGISGTGKSTQADLWKQFTGADVLNYDQVLIFLEGNSIEVCGTPWAGKENIYLSGTYPLEAIVLIEKTEENRVTELSKGEAFSRVYLNNYLYPLNEKIEDMYCDLISCLISSVPVYELRCTVSCESVYTLYKILCC